MHIFIQNVCLNALCILGSGRFCQKWTRETSPIHFCMRKILCLNKLKSETSRTSWRYFSSQPVSQSTPPTSYFTCLCKSFSSEQRNLKPHFHQLLIIKTNKKQTWRCWWGFRIKVYQKMQMFHLGCGQFPQPSFRPKPVQIQTNHVLLMYTDTFNWQISSFDTWVIWL